LPLGTIIGKQVLVGRRKNPDGSITDIWVLDPTDTLKPTTVTHPAYQKYASNASSGYTSPDNADVEFTGTEYTNVQLDDALYATHTGTASTLNKYGNVAHLFKFNLAQYQTGGNVITDVTVKWKGKYAYTGDVPDLAVIKVFKASAWEAWSAFTTTDTLYSKSLGDGSAYFYSTSWIRFGAYGYCNKYSGDPSKTFGISTNYAWVEVTYTTAPPTEIGVSDSGVGTDDVSKEIGTEKSVGDSGVGADDLSVEKWTYVSIAEVGAASEGVSKLETDEVFDCMKGHAIYYPELGYEDEYLPIRFTWNDVQLLNPSSLWTSFSVSSPIPLSATLLHGTGFLFMVREGWLLFHFRQGSALSIAVSYAGGNILIKCLYGTTKIPFVKDMSYNTNGSVDADGATLTVGKYVHFFFQPATIDVVSGLFTDRAPYNVLNGLTYQIDLSMMSTVLSGTLNVGANVGADRTIYFVGRDLGNNWRKGGLGAFASDRTFGAAMTNVQWQGVICIPNRVPIMVAFGNGIRDGLPTKIVGSDDDLAVNNDVLFLSPYIDDDAPIHKTYQAPTGVFNWFRIGFTYATTEYYVVKEIAAYGTNFRRPWIGRQYIKVKFPDDSNEVVDIEMGWYLSFIKGCENGQESGQATAFGVYIWNDLFTCSDPKYYNGAWQAGAYPVGQTYNYYDAYGAYTQFADGPNGCNRYQTIAFLNIYKGDKASGTGQAVFNGNGRFGLDVKEFDSASSPILKEGYTYGWTARVYTSKVSGTAFNPSAPTVTNDTAIIDAFFTYLATDVDADVAQAAKNFTHQKKGIIANGRHWDFYIDTNGDFVYRSSNDYGVTWSSVTIIHASMTTTSTFDVALEGTTTLHYFLLKDGVTYFYGYYRKGTLNADGTITWAAVEQQCLGTSGSASYKKPTIEIDGSGHAYIGYCFGSRPHISKNANTNGTWAVASGYPKSMKAVDNPDWCLNLVSAQSWTANAMFCIYYYPNGPVYSQYFDGGAWLTEEIVSAEPVSAVGAAKLKIASNGMLALIYHSLTSYNIMLRTREKLSTSWNSEEIVANDVGDVSFPVAVVIEGDVYVAWSDMYHIYWRKRQSNGVYDYIKSWLGDLLFQKHGISIYLNSRATSSYTYLPFSFVVYRNTTFVLRFSELAIRIVQITESAVGTEALAITVLASVSDGITIVLTDAVVAQTLVNISDVGKGTESPSIQCSFTLAETAVGTDYAGKGADNMPEISEIVSTVEVLGVTVQTTIIEVATPATDAVSSDQGPSQIDESASGSEAVGVGVQTTVSESGSAVEGVTVYKGFGEDWCFLRIRVRPYTKVIVNVKSLVSPNIKVRPAILVEARVNQT
jgi:hypothetical protein